MEPFESPFQWCLVSFFAIEEHSIIKKSAGFKIIITWIFFSLIYSGWSPFPGGLNSLQWPCQSSFLKVYCRLYNPSGIQLLQLLKVVWFTVCCMIKDVWYIYHYPCCKVAIFFLADYLIIANRKDMNTKFFL